MRRASKSKIKEKSLVLSDEQIEILTDTLRQRLDELNDGPESMVEFEQSVLQDIISKLEKLS